MFKSDKWVLLNGAKRVRTRDKSVNYAVKIAGKQFIVRLETADWGGCNSTSLIFKGPLTDMPQWVKEGINLMDTAGPYEELNLNGRMMKVVTKSWTEYYFQRDNLKYPPYF